MVGFTGYSVNICMLLLKSNMVTLMKTVSQVECLQTGLEHQRKHVCHGPSQSNME